MRRAALLVLSLVTLSPCHLVTLSPCHAAPRVDADPGRDYPITPEVGPYVVCAASYSGPNAATLARQMVLHIRQRDNLPAYYFNRGERERREQDEYLNRVREHSPPDARIRMVRIPDQFAVLIGGYPDIDSAHRDLRDLKKLKPPELKLGSGMTTQDHTIDMKTGQRLAINPFAHAFVAPNPSIPKSPVQAKGDDPFLKELNAGEAYSLLQCRKPYTLAVKEYHGITSVQPRSAAGAFLEKFGLGRKSTDMLSAGALQAHELAKVLRSKELNLEAYVLHDRRCSYVTVGGYDGLNDPEMQRMQQRLASLSFQPAGGGPAPSMEVLQLNVPAKPMRVPRP